MANYIKKVGKLLGVEVGEVFQVDGDPSIKDCFFKFSDNDLQLSAVNGGNDTWTVASGTRLLGILYGRLRIRKLPWKPTKGQKYYVPNIFVQDLWAYYSWNDDGYDEELYKRGVVFKTTEEAIEAAEKMLAAINEQ